MDEAHKIKNWKSQITKAMKKMRCKVRVGLTGTILQNNLEELYCVMDWLVSFVVQGVILFFKKSSWDAFLEMHLGPFHDSLIASIC